MEMQIWVIIGAGNGSFPEGTRPITELMFTSRRWGCVSVTIYKRTYQHEFSYSAVPDLVSRTFLQTYLSWWRHRMEAFPRYWPFLRGIHRSPVNSPHKGQLRGALMFSLIGPWINGWVSNGEADGLRRHRSHHDVIVMCTRAGVSSYVNSEGRSSDIDAFNDKNTLYKAITLPWICCIGYLS